MQKFVFLVGTFCKGFKDIIIILKVFFSNIWKLFMDKHWKKSTQVSYGETTAKFGFEQLVEMFPGVVVCLGEALELKYRFWAQKMPKWRFKAFLSPKWRLEPVLNLGPWMTLKLLFWILNDVWLVLEPKWCLKLVLKLKRPLHHCLNLKHRLQHVLYLKCRFKPPLNL